MSAERIRVGIFGCTGSIGRNALEIAARHPDRIEVIALSAGSNADELERIAAETGVKRLALGSGPRGSVPGGPDAMRALAATPELDLVVNAVVGAAGLAVTLGALDAGTDIALANKESLVMAGTLVMGRAADEGVEVRAIDSEHSALANCLRGRAEDRIRRVYLTASGGPFRGRAAGTFDSITVEEALNHPTWKMGPKITIDSATLMNKGLEIIEAHHLFNMPPEKIDVVVHPQSIIHAMVEDEDGSVIAELAPPDMRIPIQRAMLGSGDFNAPLDLKRLTGLTFEAVDREAFPLIDLAYRSLGVSGGPTVLNAANEIAVRGFLEKRVRFPAIADIIHETFEAYRSEEILSERDVYRIDGWARTFAAERLAKIP